MSATLVFAAVDVAKGELVRALRPRGDVSADGVGTDIAHAIPGRTRHRARASPAWQEIPDLLARIGPASAAGLGRLLRPPADGLDYHIRALGRPD